MRTTYWTETRAYVGNPFGSTYAYKLGATVSIKKRRIAVR